MRKNPTGMGAGTGQHYRNVAAQMQAYVHKPRQRTAHRRHYQYQPYESQAEVVAEQFFQYGAERMGLPPSFADEIGGLARNMIRNAFI
jgi:hypothetical protein